MVLTRFTIHHSVHPFTHCRARRRKGLVESFYDFGRDPDGVLGVKDLADTTPAIGRGPGAPGFWPGAVAFDGRYLCVGQFVLPGRLLRFSPSS